MPAISPTLKTSEIPPALPVQRLQVWLPVCLILLTCFTIALYANRYGFSILGWDDAEYVTNALSTADHLSSNGLLSWPAAIALDQHYGKPPLYVNSLALFIELFGRDRTPLAIGMLGAVTSALTALAVFWIMRGLTSVPFALLSMLAVFGLPGLARWAPMAFPDLQVALLVLWTVAILLGRTRALWLGIAIGLGMLAKITFPVFVIGPLLYWWWTGGVERKQRLFVILEAGLIAALIAGIWYLPNLNEAARYAGGAYGFSLRDDSSVAANLLQWFDLSSRESLSWVLLALGILASFFYFATRRAARSPFPWHAVTTFLLASLPMLAISLPSSSATSRYWIPSFVLLALTLMLFVRWVAQAARVRTPLLIALAAGVIAQWGLIQASILPATSEALRNTKVGPALWRIAPGIYQLEPAGPFESLNLLMDRIEAMGPGVPRQWFLSGNNPYINVPRLQLAAKIRRLPVTFDWADYFTWSEQETLDRIRLMQNEPAMLLVTEPIYRDAIADYLVKRSALVKAHLGEFHLLDPTPFKMAIYASPKAYDLLKDPLPPANANFANALQVLGMGSTGRDLRFRIKLLQPLSCNVTLFVHDFPPGGPMRIWDQRPNPPFCKWQPGEAGLVTFTLPPEFARDRDRLELGFFDEADAAHNWPAFKLTGGGNALCLNPVTDLSDSVQMKMPVRSCAAGGG